MKHVQLLGLSLSLLLLCWPIDYLLAAQSPTVTPKPPRILATSYILYEPSSDTILAEHRSDVRLPPASLTKIMTSYVIASEMEQGNITADELVPISVNAWRKGGSRMYVQEGDRVPVMELLKGIIIQSGNDASVAMAEHVAGSEDAFADMMNQMAKNLGLADTHYSNATGWPAEDHYSTARDMAILSSALIRRFPNHYKMYKEKEYTYANIRQQNRNLLLWRDPTVDGVKTGHTEEAGYCLVSSALRDGMRLISVIMGTDGMQARARESQKLLKYGFRNYELVEAYKAEEVINNSRVWMGSEDAVALGLEADVVITIPKGRSDDLTAAVNMDQYIRAPVQQGQVMGTFSLSLDDKTLVERPLVAMSSIEKGGMFKRLWHWIYLSFLEWGE